MGPPKPSRRWRDIAASQRTSSWSTCIAPSWSPDGRAIAYQSDWSGIYSVHIVDPAGLIDLNVTAGEPPIGGSNSWVKVKWRPR